MRQRWLPVALVALASCSAPAPLDPNDPDVTRALTVASRYADHFYGMTGCLSGGRFRYSTTAEGDTIVVAITPKQPHVDAIRLTVRKSDMTIARAQRVTAN